MKTHRLAIVLSMATYVLLLVGGLVHGTDSGLACPDWPTCYGSLMPPMHGHIFYEHTHRLVATSVGLLTVILAIALWRSRRDDTRLRRFGLFAVALVVVQGVLGGLTVLYRLPDAVSTAHLGVSMLFFATTLVLAFRTRPAPASPADVAPRLRRLVRIATVLVYCQLLLGALVRHVDGAALVCHLDVVLCKGQLWPDWHWTAKLQMLHRMNALAILATTSSTAALALRGVRGRVRALAVAAPILVVVQIVLGVLSIRSLLEVYTVTAHLGVAAAIFGDHVCLWIATRRPSIAAPADVLAAQREAHA